MYIDDVLANLAWRLIRDWRRRRDVDPATRRAWVRLYVGVIRRARQSRVVQWETRRYRTGGVIHPVELRAGIGGRTYSCPILPQSRHRTTTAAGALRRVTPVKAQCASRSAR